MQTFGKSLLLLLFCLFVSTFGTALLAQGTNLNLPRVSPAASVTQQIGVTEITINYHRPAVRDREVWGSLVPYGMSPGAPFNFNNPFPWRAGANDNTTVHFSTDVIVEGKKVHAGKYSIHILPAENGAWTLILNKDTAAWGSFFYDESKDAARISITPESVSQHVEWLLYGFEDIQPNGVTAFLHWEKMKIPFTVEVNLNETVLADIRNQLTNLAGFNWRAWMQGANYCLQNNTNHDEAFVWIDNSINSNRNLQNLSVKALLLNQVGKTAEANTILSESMQMAEASTVEADINNFGYTLLGANRLDDALKVFKMNVKKHPDSWNVYDSYGEALQKKGKTKESIKHFKTALSKAPANQKARIQNILKQLQSS